MIAFCITGVISLYMSKNLICFNNHSFIVLFSNIAISIFGGLVTDTESFAYFMLNHKGFYIICLFILLLPNALKRNMHELKMNSYLLFFGVIFLIATFIYKSALI
jgi:hypothetical protein